MSLIVAKFGGTSVADIPAIENAADKIAREAAAGHHIAVVVSAMAGVTNQLIEYCTNVSSLYDAREYDAIVSSGEQVTAGLMAIALQKRGLTARSWLGWQIPLRTTDTHAKARIEQIETDELKTRMSRGEIAVVAGFQGLATDNRITTLGRGGSDTTAVALAAALDAERCDIYTDVRGVYTTDPRITPKARMLPKISYEEMLEMASVGAKVLQTRSVEMAMKERVAVQVLSSFEGAIGSELPGTLLVDEREVMEKHVVNGITYSRDDAKITLRNLPDIPGIAARIFGPLSDAGVNVDVIVQNISPDSHVTDMTFTVHEGDLTKALDVLNKTVAVIDKKIEIIHSTDVVKISVIGIGMRSHAGVAQTMFQTLSEKGINIQLISTSEIKISVLIHKDYLELAVRTLHTAYGLDEK
ncbi:MAG: aspartate kinase [Pseudomonadota bacterium]